MFFPASANSKDYICNSRLVTSFLQWLLLPFCSTSTTSGTHNNFGDRSFNAAGPRIGTVYRRACDETWTSRVSSVNWKHFYLGVSQPRRIV